MALISPESGNDFPLSAPITYLSQKKSRKTFPGVDLRSTAFRLLGTKWRLCVP